MRKDVDVLTMCGVIAWDLSKSIALLTGEGGELKPSRTETVDVPKRVSLVGVDQSLIPGHGEILRKARNRIAVSSGISRPSGSVESTGPEAGLDNKGRLSPMSDDPISGNEVIRRGPKTIR